MKKKKVLLLLIIAGATAVAVGIAKKRKQKLYIRAENGNTNETPAERTANEWEKEAALEKVLADVEDMYRDREDIVPKKEEEEEVPAPGNPGREKQGLSRPIKLLSVLSAIALIMGVTRCATPEETYERNNAETVSIEENVSYEKVASYGNAVEGVVNEVAMENRYEELPELLAIAEEEELPEESVEEVYAENEGYSDDDIYLLAQLIVNESGNQERDGQIGVAEVVVNRINSSKFPNTVSEVIYQPGQFSNNGAIATRKPSENIVEIAREVLNGNLRVFDNADVLYFRNPMITSGIGPEVKQDWGRCPYYGYIGDHAFYLKAYSKTESLDETAIRLKIVDTAVAYGDKVESYSFGGKPNGIGDNNTNMNLDCSGFVSWVLGEALNKTDVSAGNMGSANVNNAYGLTEIEFADLSIGDIGYRYTPGTIKPVNHCGIYMGNGKWIHCNSNDNGVSIEETNMFIHYYSAI